MEAQLTALTDVRELAEVRERTASRPGEGDRGSGVLLGTGVAVVALLFAVLGPAPTAGELARLGLLVGLYVVAYRTELVLTAGGAVPTQPVLVGMLLTCPPHLAPLAVLVGLQLAETWNGLGSAAPQRLRGVVVRSAGAWSVVAPAVVLWALGAGDVAAGPVWADAPVYLLALGAQFALDATVALTRAATLSVAPRKVLPGLLWTFAVDALLAPIGLCVVLAAGGATWPLVLLLAPVGLVRLLARDRDRQLRAAISIGAAFDSVRQEARVDALTGLANRRGWAEALAASTAARDVPVGVLAADVDGLKRVNDEVGHDAGDALIREIGAVLRDVAPAGSLVARLGGDEFGVLVPMPGSPADAGADLGAALIVRLRARMAAHPGIAGYPLSCSLGWATTPPERTAEDAALRADAMAGEDKQRRRAGREHVEEDRRLAERRAAERRLAERRAG